MAIFKVFLLTLFIGLSYSQCGIGCLMCNQQNQCTLCDVTNRFYLLNNACVVSALTNCLILSNNGQCYQCNPGYYFEQTSLTCQAVPTANIVANCYYYSTALVCNLCNQDFYLDNNVCKAVGTLKANCQYYYLASDSAVQCLKCMKGYIFSNNWSTCIVPPVNQPCSEFTYIYCKVCKTNYYKDMNYYLSLQYTSVENHWNKLIRTYDYTSYRWVPQSECRAVTAVSNCLTYSPDNDICILCQSTYYLENNFCVPNPTTVILNCIRYSNNTTCIECQQGYYINGGLCSIVSNIPNCLLYDGTKTETICQRCINDYYIYNNSCNVRTNKSISDCSLYTPNEDNCE